MMLLGTLMRLKGRFVSRDALAERMGCEGDTSRNNVCVPATRLALRVLRSYLPGRELLVTFWTALETGRGKPHWQALQAMRRIVTKLVDAGHPVWAEFR